MTPCSGCQMFHVTKEQEESNQLCKFCQIECDHEYEEVEDYQVYSYLEESSTFYQVCKHCGNVSDTDFSDESDYL